MHARQGWGRLQGGDYDFNYFGKLLDDYDYNYFIKIYFNYDFDYFITITIINRDYILIIFNIDPNIYKKNLLKKSYNSNIIIFNFSIICIDKSTCKLIVIS